MSQGRAEDDDVLVLPPLPADPLFVDAVEDAVAGGSDDLPDAQPQRRVGTNPRDFASLYIRHRASFGLHARRFLSDPRDVDEVLQEAFLRLFLAMPELETELQALAYCRRTVTNLCIGDSRAIACRTMAASSARRTGSSYAFSSLGSQSIVSRSTSRGRRWSAR